MMSHTYKDGSRILTYDILSAKCFHPQGSTNNATNGIVMKMAIKAADCILIELQDPKKATHNYLSSPEGKFSWGNN